MLLRECGLLDEIFSHQDDDGSMRHFNATAMFNFCAEHTEQAKKLGIMIITAPCDQKNADFIRKNRGVEQWKLDRLVEPYLFHPIISIEFEKGVCLTVDGHHRWVKRRELGMDTIKTFVFPLVTWERFLITDMPDMKPEVFLT